MPATSLIFDLIGRDHVSAPLGKAAVSMERTATSAKRSETAVGSMVGSMKRAVPQLALFAGGAAAIAAAINIGREASAFQKQMLMIQTQAGASAKEVKAFSAEILAMSGKVAQSPEGLATSLYHVYSTGLRGAQAMKAVEVAAKGARIGNADLEETTNALTATIASGVKGSGDFAKTMGMLNTVVGAGDMKLSDLNEALGTGFLGAAKAFGVSIKDAGALLAVFGDNNIRGAEAGTQLRMVMQDLSKPAANADKELRNIGLTSDQLRKSMEKQGLAGTIQMLSQQMTKFGITGSKVGPFIEDVFTKKAGRGLGLILTQMDRLNQKLEEVGKGGSNFGESWTATTHTAAFAFDRLKEEATSAGIVLYNRLLPAVTNAALWLGQKLPAAVSTIAHIVGPFAQQVGPVLGGAWHLVAGAVSVAASGLSAIGGVLEHNKTLVTGVGVAVLGMWAAYKAFTIGAAAIKAIDLALGAMAMRMNRAGGAMAGMRGGLSGLSTATVAGGVALAGIGIALYAYSAATSAAAAIAARHKAEVDSLTQSIEQDSGALGKNTRATVENMLVQSGMYRQGVKQGISQKTLTDALLGNAAAMDQVNKKSLDGSVDSVLFTANLKGLAGEMKTAAQNAKDKAQADRLGAGASKAMGEATKLAAGATTRLKNAEQEAADAAKRLDTALQILSGRLGARQALDQFVQGVQQLKGQLDKQNHSLVGNSAAAVKNRLAVDQVVGSLLSYGDALKQQGKTQPQINSALQKQSQYLIDNAKQMGITKGQLRSYLHELHLTPSQIKTIMGVDDSAARAKIAALKAWFESLRWTAHVSANGASVSAGTGSRKAITPATGGYITGPGTGTSDSIPAMVSNGEFVVNARQTSKHLGLLHAINRGIRGYATGGTVGSTKLKGNAGTVGTAIGAVGTPYSPPFNLAQTGIIRVDQQIHHAQVVLAEQIRKGLKASTIKHLRGEIADLKREAQKQLAALTFKIKHADTSALTTALKGSVDQARQAYAQMISDVRADGGDPDTLARMRRNEAKVLSKMRRRDAVSAQLGSAPTAPTAYDQLASAQQAYGDTRSGVAGAVGAFDFTTAGVNPQVYNDVAAAPVSAGSILGQLRTAAAKAQKFSGLLKTLVKDGMPKDLVMQLAQAGPAAYDQAAALAAATPAQIQGIVSSYSDLTKAGGGAGSTVANAYYKHGVDAATALVKGLRSKESTLNTEITSLGDRIVSELENKLGAKHPPSTKHHGGNTENHYHAHGIEDPHTFARLTEAWQARRALAGT